MKSSVSNIYATLLSWPARRRLMIGTIHSFFFIWSIIARFYRRILLRDTRLIAVVGTYGKSTATRAISKMINKKIHRYSTNNKGFFVAHAIFRTKPVDHFGVVEVGISGPGQMSKYATMVQPNIVVVTSIGSEHHTSLRTLGITRNEKAEMVRALPKTGLAILNGDDENVTWMKSQTDANIITYGLGGENDVFANGIEQDWPHGIRVHVRGFNQEGIIRSQLIGKPGVYTILCATAVGLSVGYKLNEISKSLEDLTPTVGRLETIALRSGAWLIRDEHKSNEETMSIALDAFSVVPAHNRIAIIGMVSELTESTGKVYRRLGRRVAQVADQVIFIGSTKTIGAFRAEAIRSGLCPERITCVSKAIPDALESLPQQFNQDDAILVTGRASLRLDRISLALMGKNVQCDIRECLATVTRCHHCKILEQGGISNQNIIW